MPSDDIVLEVEPPLKKGEIATLKKSKRNDDYCFVKFCKLCERILPLTEFHKQKKTKDGFKPVCKECSKANQTKHRQRLRLNVQTLQKIVGCNVCGLKDPVCLDFHHFYSREKEAEVSYLLACGSTKKLKDEIKRCVVLCANCHRRFHAGALHRRLDSFTLVDPELVELCFRVSHDGDVPR